MIKLLKKYQIQTTPFTTVKDWTLNNSDNENLLLFESTGPDDGMPIALEFIDYGDGSEYPVDNNSCNIALEQQSNDLAIIETGLNIKGIFYPDSEPKNEDGTYQRSIYHQIETMFYNMYLDPSKMWGVENIDFQMSETKRLLSDKFQLIDIPRRVYGEKIIPKTFISYDNTLDNSYQIKDDGNGNLFAGINLFSHQQELGEHTNEFIVNMSSSYCDNYWAIREEPLSDTTTIQMSFLYGTTDLAPPITDYATFPVMSFLSGSLLETVITNSSSIDSSSFVIGFLSGSTMTTVLVDSSSIESQSYSINFFTGSAPNVVTVISGSPLSGSSPESSPFYTSFFTGSYVVTTFPVTMSFEDVQFMTGFVGGNVI